MRGLRRVERLQRWEIRSLKVGVLASEFGANQTIVHVQPRLYIDNVLVAQKVAIVGCSKLLFAVHLLLFRPAIVHLLYLVTIRVWYARVERLDWKAGFLKWRCWQGLL